ncbi:MAG: Lrp/AsnC family transcriptional regulator [Ruminococcaceae bacterium]|nr:Lrp/AsnC family transcriptional regulator [Oscillospiraceae bacterium]
MDKILKLLNTDARLTTEQMAVMANMTEDEVTAAIAKLEADGVIRGYKPLIDWEKTGEEVVTAIIELSIAPSKDEGFDGIAKTIMAMDEVESLSLMSGGHDLMVTVTGRTFKDVALFVAKRLSSLDGVLGTATHFVLKKYKERGVLFEDEEQDERGTV